MVVEFTPENISGVFLHAEQSIASHNSIGPLSSAGVRTIRQLPPGRRRRQV
jgi:hypothetical protein